MRLSQQGLSNSAAAQNNAGEFQKAGLWNQAQGQEAGQQLQLGQQGIAAASANNQASAQNAQIWNQAQQNEVQNKLAQAQQAMQAQNQNVQQGFQNAGLWNSGVTGTAGLMHDQVAFNNTANQQDIQNAFANAGLSNQARQQGLNENAQLRQMPLNELMAMMSGSQVQSPQFGQGVTQAMQPTNVAGIYGDANKAAAGTQNSLMGGLASLGGTALANGGMTALLGISDRRLKRNIQRIGRTRGGLNIYEYDIAGHRTWGVMAQEVMVSQPNAVAISDQGYLGVDYAQVR